MGNVEAKTVHAGELVELANWLGSPDLVRRPSALGKLDRIAMLAAATARLDARAGDLKAAIDRVEGKRLRPVSLHSHIGRCFPEAKSALGTSMHLPPPSGAL